MQFETYARFPFKIKRLILINITLNIKKNVEKCSTVEREIYPTPSPTASPSIEHKPEIEDALILGDIASSRPSQTRSSDNRFAQFLLTLHISARIS
jgi:hypothetical protein